MLERTLSAIVIIQSTELLTIKVVVIDHLVTILNIVIIKKLIL